ncbi:Non-reducing polyketide synthase nscA [Golovinomyces cichoracearum]|uniref:Non-reducing polyketide synthase nscA n=1 Tax=Golovinomyces cichoracearum TaxID=62708 RepID=A0A420I1H6_9PEZI|nr:Non-reducing polyketide synthase nscA [Golovinomyces cichoracearum]
MDNESSVCGLAFCNSEFTGPDPLQIFRKLRKHSQKSRFPLLSKFLSESATVLREEICRLNCAEWGQFSRFQSILNLACLVLDEKECSWDSPRVPLEGALLCVSQIALLIGRYEAENLEYNLPQQNLSVLGLRGGLFAATTISVSQSLFELASIGSEAVRAAFRFHNHIHQISQIVEPRAVIKNFNNRGYTVKGVSKELIQAELDKFNQKKDNFCSPNLQFIPANFYKQNYSDFTEIYISNTDNDSVCVIGPQTQVDGFFKSSPLLCNSCQNPLETDSGLCNATDVYNDEDVQAIVESLNRQRWEKMVVCLPLIAPSSGEYFCANNGFHLLELACKDALSRPHFQKNLMKKFPYPSNPQHRSSLDCRIFSYGTSLASQQLLSDIEANYPNARFIRYDLTHWIHEDIDGSSLSTGSCKIAVVGMSCRLPGGANNPELLLQLLNEGHDVHTRVPSDRFDVDSHFDPTGTIENASETPYGNFIDNPGFFDAGFFNMSSREAEQTDPMHRLALMTAYEALEMSGFSPNRTPSTNLKRIGTFYGVASDDYREVNAGQNIGTHATPGGERAFANGRINYLFKFGGPSFNIDTACSSSGAAINAACSSLWAGDVDMAIAGGLNIITNPDNYCMLSKGHFLSKTGQCKVWSEEADGYCRADGIGCIVIKRLEDAIAENDNIIATILAASTNHSAEAISITHPHVGAQMDNYNQILQHAGVDPLDVSYVELHGTGTQAGDGAESSSVAQVFAPVGPVRKADNPLYVGAIKSNIGHGEAAAGVASFIKVLLAYQHDQIPRNVKIRNKMNPLVAANIHNRNIKMITENTPWPRIEGKKRYAVANSFGAHGGNTTFLLEEAPLKVKIGHDTRSVYPITLSAKSVESLKGNIESLISYLDQNPMTELGDLSYTLCARRMHHHTRIATPVKNLAQLKKFLTSSAQDLKNLRPVPNKKPCIAFTFPGQGVLYENVASQLFQDFPSFRKDITRLERISQRMGFPPITPLIKNSAKLKDHSPIATQLALLIIEIALTNFWKQLGIIPSVVIGHSLGEYAALVAAGVLSAADAIFLVGRRAEIIISTCEAGSHAMLSVRASVEMVDKIAAGLRYEIACINSATDIVIAGTQEDIQLIQQLIGQKGLKCVRLALPFAFHSSQLDPVLDLFEEQARKITFHPPKIPVISPLLAKCVNDGETFNSNYLRRSSREPVNFIGGLEAASELGILNNKVAFLDIGPHPVCQAFIQSHFSVNKIFASLRRNEEDFSTIVRTLVSLQCEGFPILWNGYFAPFEKSYNLLHLGHYAWNQKDYWLPYKGTWTLEKAHGKAFNFHMGNYTSIPKSAPSPLISSSVHQIVSHDLQNSKCHLVTLSDIMHADLWKMIGSHRIRRVEVAPSSIWVDMAYTIAEYLYKIFLTESEVFAMDLADFSVFHSTLARKDRSKPQLLQAHACFNFATRSTSIEWYKISLQGIPLPEPYASATVYYQDPTSWKKEWRVVQQFLKDRIEILLNKARDGFANKISKKMVYSMFKNIVHYDEIYQGIQCIILDGFEAFSEITLGSENGNWFTPPHFIECILAVAGFVMNCSDEFDHQENFAMCPGWGDLRFLKRLESGDKLRSYVRMVPSENHLDFYGDVVVMQDEEIIGMCTQMKFRRVPRVLMDKFFSPKNTAATDQAKKMRIRPLFPGRVPQPETPSDSDTSGDLDSPFINPDRESISTLGSPESINARIKLTTKKDHDKMIADIMGLISRETGLDFHMLCDESTFVEHGVDSLTSLVLVQKFRVEMNIEIHSSIFLDFPTIREFKDHMKNRFSAPVSVND